MIHISKIVCAKLSVLFLVLLSAQTLLAGDSYKPRISYVRTTQITAYSAVITWTTNEPASSQVKYGKSTSYGSWSALSTNLVTSHSVLLSSLATNTTYYYRAMSRDAAGNLQTSYNYKFRTLSATLPPSAPSNTTATTASSSRIDVSWSDNSSNESGFYVYQSVDGTNFSQVGSTAAGVRTYSAQNLQSQKTYYYRVRSYNTAGSSTDSNTASATTSATAPSAPSNTAATAMSSSRIDVSWSDNSSNESGFYVYQSVDGTNFSQIGSTAADVRTYSAQNLQSEKMYYYRVRSYNSTGSSADSNTASATTSGTVPGVPSNTTATAASSSRIDVSWTDNSSNESGFYVYQSLDGSNFSQVGSTAADVSTYVAQNLQSEKTYYYRVRSYNSTGSSADSNTASATTEGAVPGVPLNLAAATGSASKIDLSWTDNSVDESGFYVYQSTDGTNYSQIATVNANVAAYAVQNLQSQKTYHYRVRSYNSTGSSADSNTASATTQGTAPSAPTNLSAATVSKSQIDLTWSDNASDENGFYVYQSTDGSNFTHVATLNANTVSYASQSLQSETTYYYFVCAYNAVDNSLDSNIANATTNGNPAPAKAFPGAVGFGIDTPGGRGGAILKVTNLNDSGSGSLRAALAATGPRTIIFEVSGTINLLSELKITSPFVTIAGQTAPSPGITLKGGEFNVKTHDVIVQHIRVRLGDQLPSGTDPGGADTLSTEGPAYNVVMDHVSASWGIDENGTTWYDDLRDVTLSNCIISEALYNSIHPKGAHSMGLLVTPNGRNVAMVGNLLAHNSDRNPLISNGSSSVIANNVFYNWVGGRATNIGNYSSSFPQKYPTEVSIIGNVYIKGYNTTSSTNAISTSTSLSDGAKIYVYDNVLVGVATLWRNVVAYDPLVSTPPVQIQGFTPLRGANVEASVLNKAGARPADRDEVDHRIVHEVNTRTGRLINSQSEVGGWPTLPLNRHTINVPSNANADDDGDGYTNFEEQVLFPMAAAVEGR